MELLKGLAIGTVVIIVLGLILLLFGLCRVSAEAERLSEEHFNRRKEQATIDDMSL